MRSCRTATASESIHVETRTRHVVDKVVRRGGYQIHDPAILAHDAHRME